MMPVGLRNSICTPCFSATLTKTAVCDTESEFECRFLYVAAATDEQTGFPFRRVTKLDVRDKRADSWLAPAGELPFPVETLEKPLFLALSKPVDLDNKSAAVMRV